MNPGSHQRSSYPWDKPLPKHIKGKVRKKMHAKKQREHNKQLVK